jgi:hypothetical protein
MKTKSRTRVKGSSKRLQRTIGNRFTVAMSSSRNKNHVAGLSTCRRSRLIRWFVVHRKNSTIDTPGQSCFHPGDTPISDCSPAADICPLSRFGTEFLFTWRLDAGYRGSNGFANRTGMAKLEPPKSRSMATFTAMTLPSALNSGPPDPPDVVWAS